jgi:Tripartite tricarboxylate transporter TctB family
MRHPATARSGSSQSVQEFSLSLQIRHHKDFWSGVLFVAAGVTAVVVSRDYSMGTAGRMGPAYFPTVLGSLLALIGLIVLIRSFFGHSTEKIKDLALKPYFLISVSIVLFGLLFRQTGLIVAVPLLIFISAFSSIKFRFFPIALLAVGLTVFSWLLFVKLLGLPITLVGPWFTG